MPVETKKPSFLSTAKGKLATVGFVGLSAIQAFAEVTMDNQGVVSGKFEMGTFNGLAVAVLAALGAMWIIKRAFGLIK